MFGPPFPADATTGRSPVIRPSVWNPRAKRKARAHYLVPGAQSETWPRCLCEWLSARLGYEVRLPTEWQWQQAATGGDPAKPYPWGEWEEGRANTVESELERVTPVGLYPHGCSVQGVLDLAGNVWEWCLNQYDAPRNVSLVGEARRVVRGGSWNYSRADARCASRLLSHPGDRFCSLGFRLVCVSPIR